MLSIVNKKSEWDHYQRSLENPCVYNSYDYVKAVESLEEGRAELAVFQNNGYFVFHPYVKRKVGFVEGVYDVTSPYDFGGFWFNTREPSLQSGLMISFQKEFSRYCKDKRICSEFVRFYPFNDFLSGKQYGEIFITENVVVNLKKDIEDIYSGFRSSLKRAIRKAESHRLYQKRITPVKFLELYHENLKFLGSRGYYFFPLTFLRSIDAYCDILFTGAYDSGGHLCSAHVYLKDGKNVFYYLGASNRQKLPKRPNDFLFWNSIRLFKNSGFERLHLGGGAPSLLNYKQKFSKDRAPYYTGTKIFCPDLYDRLTDFKEKDTGQDLKKVNFFPRYRSDNE